MNFWYRQPESVEPRPEVVDINQPLRSIVNVTWSINIENAREYWNIEVHDSVGGVTKFRVEYEAMAMLVFKLGQLTNHIPSLDFSELFGDNSWYVLNARKV